MADTRGCLVAHAPVSAGKGKRLRKDVPAAGRVFAAEVAYAEGQRHMAGQLFRHLDPPPSVAVDTAAAHPAAGTRGRAARGAAPETDDAAFVFHTVQGDVP